MAIDYPLPKRNTKFFIDDKKVKRLINLFFNKVLKNKLHSDYFIILFLIHFENDDIKTLGNRIVINNKKKFKASLLNIFNDRFTQLLEEYGLSIVERSILRLTPIDIVCCRVSGVRQRLPWTERTCCPMLQSYALTYELSIKAIRDSWYIHMVMIDREYQGRGIGKSLVDIIKEKLMRTLVAVLPDVIDELSSAVPDYIPTRGEGQ